MHTESNAQQQGGGSTSAANQVSLLFCDHLTHENSNQAFTNEISFVKPVRVQQIRILKGGSQIQPKFKPNMNTSLTQSDSIKSLEIFAKDLQNNKARFETLVFASNLKELYTQDAIFTINKEVISNHLVIRGSFKQITIMVYGDVIEDGNTEVQDVPLEALKEDNENLAKFQRHDQGDEILEVPASLTNMLNQYKSTQNILKTANAYVNTDNIRRSLLFEEKDDKKVRANEDFVKMIELYTKELNKVISGTVVVDQTSKYLQHIDQLQSHIDEYLKQNDGHIRLPADFNDNPNIYHQIPLSVVKICLHTFSMQYDDLTEVYHGLELAKSFLSSLDHAYDFIQGDGLEKIYQTIIEKEGYVSPFLKILALEVINMCLNYDFACERFLNLDITKLENFIDQTQTEVIKKDKDREREKDKEKERDRERERDRDRERDRERDRDREKDRERDRDRRDRDDSKDRKSAKSKSKALSPSKSRSRSKSSKKSKKRKHKDRKSKKDRSRSTSRSLSKSHTKKKSSKHKKKRDSDSTSESRSPSRPRKSSRTKEISTIELKINTGYQKVLNQVNKSENTKVNYAIRQVLHKIALYCYLSDFGKIVENELVPEIEKLRSSQQEGSFRDRNTRLTHLNEIIDNVRKIFMITNNIHILCTIDLDIVKKFFTNLRFTIIV